MKISGKQGKWKQTTAEIQPVIYDKKKVHHNIVLHHELYVYSSFQHVVVVVGFGRHWIYTSFFYLYLEFIALANMYTYIVVFILSRLFKMHWWSVEFENIVSIIIG